MLRLSPSVFFLPVASAAGCAGLPVEKREVVVRTRYCPVVEDLELVAGEDLIERLAHENDPVRALVELVWNAVDAEAEHVSVTIERDEADWNSITAVHVVDDGHGISVDEVRTAFGHVGNSPKRKQNRTKNGKRGLHGSKGEGRLRGFALGSRVVWDSVAADTAGVIYRLTIEADTGNRRRFRPVEVLEPAGRPGTRFTAWNDAQRALKQLDDGSARRGLLATFAPVLLNNADLAIDYDGERLDPTQEILDDTELVVPYTSSGRDHEVKVRIIEWVPGGKTRSVHAGVDDGRWVFEQDPSPLETKFPFSAYITFPGLHERDGEISLGDSATEPIGDGWRAAERAIRDHFRDRRFKRRREQVELWKRDKVYPYAAAAPASETERAERAVFDVVAGALAPYVPPSSSGAAKQSAKLMLSLIRDSLRHDPIKFGVVLKEVSGLNPDELDTLSNLLGQTKLSAIIRSANEVASRNNVLTALRQMLFDQDDSPTVKERDHLHRILERELWVFGEGYNMMRSERSLTNVLRDDLQLAGLPDEDVTTVRKWDDKTGRVDLHLAVKTPEHDRTRHLIVELKAPGVEIGSGEILQVEKYANALITDRQFAVASSEWDIILLGTGIKPEARTRVMPPNAGTGLFWEQHPSGGPHVRVFLRQWSEVLSENKTRLEFFRSLLDHDPSTAEGIEWVREKYPDFVPATLGVQGLPASTAREEPGAV